MGLLNPLPGGTVTQPFGHSTMGLQPSMWRVGSDHAYWLPIPGSTFDPDCHGGLDIAGKPEGTALIAGEAGTVTRSAYDASNGGGHVVEVEIRYGVKYSYAHCYSRLAYVGQRVVRGQAIARVGSTGTATGVHVHMGVTMYERGTDGIMRTILYNPAHFLVGGSKQNDSRILPPGQAWRYVTVNSTGVNIRLTPDLDVGSSNIWAVSRPDGIYLRDGTKYANAGSRFHFVAFVGTDDGEWIRMKTGNRIVYVYRPLAKLS